MSCFTHGVKLLTHPMRFDLLFSLLHLTINMRLLSKLEATLYFFFFAFLLASTTACKDDTILVLVLFWKSYRWASSKVPFLGLSLSTMFGLVTEWIFPSLAFVKNTSGVHNFGTNDSGSDINWSTEPSSCRRLSTHVSVR